MVFKDWLLLFTASIGAAICYRLRRPLSLLAEKQVVFYIPAFPIGFLGGARGNRSLAPKRAVPRIIYFSFFISTQGSGWGSSPSR